MLDLSVSLNPVAPDVAALAAGHLTSLRRYPDAADATAALAEAMGVDRARLLLTNGGAEAIALAARVLGGSVREPEFRLHPRDGGPWWRSDPHNPTGRLAPPDAVAAVWDEAFYPLATGRWTAGRDAVVVGSLTKLFACPGLRLGYVLSPDDELTARFAARQPAWSVGSLATALLPELLARVDLAAWAARVAELRRSLTDVLAAAGLDPQPSDANFVLCTRAAGLRERVAAHGVAVRDCASFGLADCARVAVPDDAGLDRLARALEATA